MQGDTEIDAWLRKTLITAHHPAGTFPMGTTPAAVLDPEMRVRGVEGLRWSMRRRCPISSPLTLTPA